MNSIKRVGIFVLFVFSLCSMVLLPITTTQIANATTPPAQDGTYNSPYLISTCDELQAITSGANQYPLYWLTNNIDCSASASWNGGKGFNPIDNFTGSLDGRGYTINGLYINRPDEDSIGLFNSVYDSQIHNLFIDDDSLIIGGNTVGSFAGYASASILSGLGSQATVQAATTAGGLIGRQYGWSDNMTIEKSSFTGNVTATTYGAGGIVGVTVYGYTHRDLYVNASVQGDYAGGIIGISEQSCGYRNLQRSITLGTVNGSIASGGLYGQMKDLTCYVNTLTGNYAEMTHAGAGAKGGIVGNASSSNVLFTNTYFNNSVVLDCVGTSTFSNLQQIAECIGGSKPDISSPPFDTWDFTNIWQNNAGTPNLRLPFANPVGPQQVQNLVAEQGDSVNRLAINWQAPASMGTYPLNYYRVEVKKSTDSWEQAAYTDTTTSLNSYAYDLKLGTTYDVRVQAVTRYAGGVWVTTTYTTPVAPEIGVSTCDELQNLDSIAGGDLANITLQNDIDCSGIDFFRPLGGNEWDSGFRGVFDGQGYAIRNLNIEEENYSVGLFSEAYDAVIKDLRLEGGRVQGDGNVGSLIGYAEDVEMTNVTSDLNVQSLFDTGGGIVGYVEYYQSRTLTGISYSGTVQAGGTAGGLYGEIDIYDPGTQVTLARSSSEGSVSALSDNDNIGGIVGYTYIENYSESTTPDSSLTIEDSYSTMDVSGNYNIAGIVGYAEISNDGYAGAKARLQLDRVYSAGNITAEYSYAGGLVGSPNGIDSAGEEFIAKDSFATGLITAAGDDYALIGGDGWAEDNGTFVGQNLYFDITNTGQIQRSYNDGIENGFGKNGSGDEPNYFKGNTTNPPLNNWDFQNIWQVNENALPTLRALPASSGTDSVSLNSAVNGSPITLSQIGCDSIDSASTLKEAQLATEDVGYEYPYGLVDFTMSGCGVGGTSTVTITFTGDIDISKLTFRKHNASIGSFTTLTSENSDLAISLTTLDGKPAIKVAYQVVDGGALDADGVANGAIVDPAGVAVLTVGVPNTGLISL